MTQGENSIAAKPANKWWRMLEGLDVNLAVVDLQGMPQLAEWFNDS